MDTIKNAKRIIIATICIFALTTTTVFAAIDEMEYNDTMAYANTFKVGETVYGVTDGFNYQPDGNDYYKFIVPISGTVMVSVWADSIPSVQSAQIRLKAYDSNNNELGVIYDSFNTSSGKSMTFGVTCGKTYYICIVGDYYGFRESDMDYHFTVKYSIGKTTISKIKGQKKAFNVKWVKKDKASFYQVRYTPKSTYQDYAWNRAKVVTVDKKYGNKTIKNLSKKKNYYVQVRVARKIEGITYYSAWSPRKTVKTK